MRSRRGPRNSVQGRGGTDRSANSVRGIDPKVGRRVRFSANSGQIPASRGLRLDFCAADSCATWAFRTASAISATSARISLRSSKGALPQHRVTKLSPRPAGLEDLARIFKDAVVAW